MKFCVQLMREHMAAGRLFLLEHPARATSWELPELQDLAFSPGVYWTQADQCMFGLTAVSAMGETMAAMKPTGILSTAWCLIDDLAVTCDKQHAHQPLIGGRAAGAATYLLELCNAICRGLARQRNYDRTGLVGGKQFGCGELKAATRNFIASICQGETKEASDKEFGDYFEFGEHATVDGDLCEYGNNVISNNGNMANNNFDDNTLHVRPGDGIPSSEWNWCDSRHEPEGTEQMHIVPDDS